MAITIKKRKYHSHRARGAAFKWGGGGGGGATPIQLKRE